jgi:hypothetical protein
VLSTKAVLLCSGRAAKNQTAGFVPLSVVVRREKIAPDVGIRSLDGATIKLSPTECALAAEFRNPFRLRLAAGFR